MAKRRTRQQKYPDTKTFHFYNANPHGRITGDCVTRAIATALDIDYNIAVFMGAIVQVETGYDNATAQGIDYILKRVGWSKQKQPRKWDGTKYTGKEFCAEIQRGIDGDFYYLQGKRIVANIGGHHTVAIVDGKVWDIWNSTGGCIGNYWTKD